MNKYEKLHSDKNSGNDSFSQKANSLINLKDYKVGQKSNKKDDSSIALDLKDIEKGDSIKVHPTPP